MLILVEKIKNAQQNRSKSWSRGRFFDLIKQNFASLSTNYENIDRNSSGRTIEISIADENFAKNSIILQKRKFPVDQSLQRKANKYAWRDE